MKVYILKLKLELGLKKLQYFGSSLHFQNVQVLFVRLLFTYTLFKKADKRKSLITSNMYKFSVNASSSLKGKRA